MSRGHARPRRQRAREQSSAIRTGPSPVGWAMRVTASAPYLLRPNFLEAFDFTFFRTQETGCRRPPVAWLQPGPPRQPSPCRQSEKAESEIFRFFSPDLTSPWETLDEHGDRKRRKIGSVPESDSLPHRAAREG